VGTLTAVEDRRRVVIMGAGPAGLTAAYELMKHDVSISVIEKDPTYVGGLARTVEHNGYRFDIGGHRFFSKNQEVEDLWTEILGAEMLTRGRLSRIYYRGRFFAYPLKAANALWNLGLVETIRCLASYARARVFPIANPRSFEDWVRNQFGWRLYSIFFKTYTEKVWGISTTELSADWAAQRIKSLDMWLVVKSALLPHRKPTHRDDIVTTLIDSFRYPRLGPGQMWERVAAICKEKGSPVMFGRTVDRIVHEGGRVRVVVTRSASGETEEHSGTDFISSIPIKQLIGRLDPPAPEPVLNAANRLGYRDFISVALMIDKADVFPDNWIYIHDPSVRVGRIQNFKNWSPAMVPDQAKTCLGLEYFCFEGDGLWTSDDATLVKLATKELVQLGVCSADQVFDGAVVRQAKAYPVYDDSYQAHVDVVREYLRSQLGNLHLAGRNGMHKYNNQDHSMMTALLVARNIATGSSHDPFKVNAEAVYHEDLHVGERDSTGRQVPQRLADASKRA
jgi:protoporphyrinogen oxidase